MRLAGKNALGLAIAVVLGLVASVGFVSAAEATAFALAKEGNRYVGEQAKDKILQIRSEKSVGTTVPIVWYVVYHDPTATFKAVEVKFGGGKMLDVKRPLHLLEPITGSHQPLDLSKFTVDSDKAIEIALKEPILDKLSVKATSAKLERGDADQPVWRVRVWAAKLRNPNEQVSLGEIVLSPEDGKVMENGIHIHRVD
jgi:hypothetical protein